MYVTYDCIEFERVLVITFPDECWNLKYEIRKMLDEYYDEWMFVEDIDDPEERAYVHDSCLEEHMMKRLSEKHNTWIEWMSLYYGKNEDEMAFGDVIVKNRSECEKQKGM